LRLWRVTWRLLAIALVVPGYYLWLRISDAAIRAAGRLFGSTTSTAMRRTHALHRWARAVATLLGMRMETRGSPPVAPFFLVSNHVSYTDIVLIAAQLPCVFVAKAEVARWPVMGGICRIVDTVFIDRTNKRDIPRAMAEIESVLGQGRGVVVFPEGTSTSGESVLRFRPSLLETAARAGIPVSHACLYYETPPGHPSARDTVCWFGGVGFLGHMLKILQLPWIRARVTFGGDVIRGGDRKELASRLHAAVEGNFEPMTRSVRAE
jgi:1-acyl-sn-glycerol-3-phosphate acyltransferase